MICGSGLRLNDDTDISYLIGGSLPDVSLRLVPPWFNCGLSLALVVCVLGAIFFFSSQFVN